MITLLLTLLNFHKKVSISYISKQILSIQKMANVERWVPSWQWHVFSMGSVNTHINLNMEKQNLTKNERILLDLNHHLIKNARILTLDKLTAKEIYCESWFHHSKINQLLQVTFKKTSSRITPLIGSKFTCYHDQ